MLARFEIEESSWHIKGALFALFVVCDAVRQPRGNFLQGLLRPRVPNDARGMLKWIFGMLRQRKRCFGVVYKSKLVAFFKGPVVAGIIIISTNGKISKDRCE